VSASDPDAPLVRRAQRGDRLAFERLVDRHQHRLFTLAARTLGSRSEAEDAVQEAFLRAWRNLGSFRGTALFSTWLYRICVNAAHDLRERRVPEPVEAAETTPDSRDRFVDRELSGELQRALAELDDDQRRTVVLCDVLGCSYAEAAEALEVAEGTVKSRLFRARRELAQRLGTGGAIPESKEW
jgi:RNA polymerase sigma-70 factor (ECF subfamily)